MKKIIKLGMAALTALTMAGCSSESEDVKTNTIFIDYAHTPDAMENVLKSVKCFCKNKIITIFGCGEIISDKVKEWYKDKDIKTYHSKMSKKEKENYKEADIISTTPQSCGTGFDLPGLRYKI